VAALADFVGDAANLERVGMGVAVRHEAADSRDAHQNPFVAQFAQRAVRRHAGYAE